jgi:type II secretory pathway pseudopilin PulG
LVETLFVMGLLALCAAIAIPQATVTLDGARATAAARYLAGRMALARTEAVSRSATVALRFEDQPAGIAFGVYLDGNHDGVRTADINAGVDPRLDGPVRLWELFPGVSIGVTAASGQRDPVQVGASNILSFTPAGTSTSGSIYIRGRDDSQLAVRVLGATGRTRVLRHDPRRGTWGMAI